MHLATLLWNGCNNNHNRIRVYSINKIAEKGLFMFAKILPVAKNEKITEKENPIGLFLNENFYSNGLVL